MAITKVYVASTDNPTKEEIEEIKAAAKLPISYDDDSPELTEEQYAAMAKEARKQRKTKPVIALRISLATLEKAKATGKGYTGFLSRLLDNAINDPDLVARSLHR